MPGITLVLPLFDFNDYVYDCLTVNDSHTLQKLQNTALRSILRVDFHTSIADIHKMAGFPYLSTHRFCHTATEMYMVMNHLAPEINCNRFVWVEDISNIATCSAARRDLYLPVMRLQQTKHPFVCHGVMTWNGLPDDVRAAATLKEFKKWVELLY